MIDNSKTALPVRNELAAADVAADNNRSLLELNEW